MTDRTPDDLTEDDFMPVDAGRFDTPLDFIARDHDRVRQMCALIEDTMVRPGTPPEITARIAGFIRTELPVLIADEDEDLLPLMQRRCLPEDEIDRLRTRLDAEHDKALYLLPDALEILDLLGQGDNVSDARRHLLLDFATHLRRHLIFETAILLPLARARLTPDDLATLRAQILRRRGHDNMAGDDDAA